MQFTFACVVIRPQAMYSIRDYVTNTGGGADGQHVAMAGWFWWSWNANSGDTGGLVRTHCGFGPVLCEVIGEPIKRLAQFIGEPIKLTGKRTLGKALT